MSFSIDLNENELLALYKLVRDACHDSLLQGVLKKLEMAVFEVASIGEIEESGDNERS
jgi:hypothetical protein